jgi:hypothetical protein
MSSETPKAGKRNLDMTNFVASARKVIALMSLVAASLVGAVASAQSSAAGPSQFVTWSCAGAVCPWGTSVGNQALVWPVGVGAISLRHDYVTSQPVYLPAASANGAVIQITSGGATLYAGAPDASSHRALMSLSAGSAYEVSGLLTDEVLSVQSDYAFGYSIFVPAAPVPEVPMPGAVSELVTWTCTTSPCPWGYSDSGQALVWPDTAQPLTNRLGYTTSRGVYLAANRANGATIQIDSGSATLFAGAPDAGSHRVVTTISAGYSYVVAGLASGEVLSVQGASSFRYEITLPPAPPPSVDWPASRFVTWTCGGSICPWGPTSSNHALVWPASAGAISTRLGYTTSSPVYLPSSVANGASITIKSGSASVYAGLPSASSHRLLASLVASSGTVTVSGLGSGEVLSVQADALFTYDIVLPPPAPPPPPPPPGTVYESVSAHWLCNIVQCTTGEWIGAVVDWPSWAAYSSNSRTGENSRTVYDDQGGVLHPYMGAWAEGCEVTALSGVVLIIEWERGTDVWRETVLNPGDVHVIHLAGRENGAMIETTDAHRDAFSVSLRNCAPQTL